MFIISDTTNQGTEDEISDEKAEKDKKRKEALQNIKSLGINIGATALVLWLCLTFVFGIYIQTGEDMYPRVRDGDLVLFYRMDKEYDIDDVLTFTADETRYTARYVAMAGDVIDITDEGQLVINGNIQQEEIYYATFQMESSIEYPYTVPENCVFLLGDFRTNAVDSRIYGAVSIDNIDGKIITIIRRRGI